MGNQLFGDPLDLSLHKKKYCVVYLVFNKYLHTEITQHILSFVDAFYKSNIVIDALRHGWIYDGVCNALVPPKVNGFRCWSGSGGMTYIAYLPGRRKWINIPYWIFDYDSRRQNSNYLRNFTMIR